MCFSKLSSPSFSTGAKVKVWKGHGAVLVRMPLIGDYLWPIVFQERIVVSNCSDLPGLVTIWMLNEAVLLLDLYR
jgi:hypothetical protein